MYRKNVAGQYVMFQLNSPTTGAGVTGASVTVRRCIDGTFAAGGGVVTEDSGGTAGYYKYAMSQADTNGNDVSFVFSATGAITVEKTCIMTAADPTDGVRFGLTALPNAAAGANTGLPVVGTQIPNATAGAANGLLISGSNAGTVTFDAFTITNALTVSGGTTFTSASGPGFVCSTTSAGANGVHFLGYNAAAPSSQGNGFVCIGGSNSSGTNGGAGLLSKGGAGTNNGGNAFTGTAGSGSSLGNGRGMELTGGNGAGTTKGEGLYLANASASGAALNIGASSGTAIQVTGTTTLTGAVTANNASNDIRGVTLAATGLNGVLIDSTYNLPQYVKGIGAAVAGAESGGPGGPAFKTFDGLVTAVTGTADSSGNRSGVSYAL